MYGEIIKARLSEQARKIRRELGLSQERMSEELRITTRAYGDLERGKYCFSASAFGILSYHVTSCQEVKSIFSHMPKKGVIIQVGNHCQQLRLQIY